jgi:hypothetical protein
MNTTYEDLPFCIDSGCTSHSSPVCSDFIKLVPIKHRNVCGMSGVAILAIEKGTIFLRCESGKNLMLKGVLYIPQAALWLISVGRLTDDDLETTFGKTLCAVKTLSGKTIATGKREGTGLYFILECSLLPLTW